MVQVGLSTMTCGDASDIDRRLRCIPRMSHAPAIRLGSRTISLAPYPGQARRLTLIRPARKDDEAIPVLPELAAAARRGDHLDTEAPARPLTPRWPHPPVGRWAGIVQRLLALN